MPEDSRSAELFECPLCLKKVEKLYPVTQNDMQRQHIRGWKVCDLCLQNLRDSGRQIVRYTGRTVIRDLGVTTSLLFLVLVSISYALSTFSVHSLIGVSRLSFYPSLVAFLTGLFTSFGGIRDRYALSHGLMWSAKTRSVTIGLAFIIAGLLSATAIVQLRI